MQLVESSVMSGAEAEQGARPGPARTAAGSSTSRVGEGVTAAGRAASYFGGRRW